MDPNAMGAGVEGGMEQIRTMTPEQMNVLLNAVSEWGAEQQSSVNTALLALIALLITGIALGARAYLNKVYSELRDDIRSMLDEIKSLKSDAIDTGEAIARHEEAIETLKHRRR